LAQGLDRVTQAGLDHRPGASCAAIVAEADQSDGDHAIGVGQQAVEVNPPAGFGCGEIGQGLAIGRVVADESYAFGQGDGV